MPTYDYECDACHHKFELFQSITAEPEKKCPECGKRKLRRLIGAGAGFVFKGSGFYLTDYRSESYKKRAEADKPAETKSESKSGDAKPAETKASETKSTGGGQGAKPEKKTKRKDS